ncbi:DUF4328 domain-containing protein [Kitasatospora sp. NA04385]|uniref:DUF4328 domain-containing protein n=1 Tax=Kitasatospora sp. NA04385 TaxID=2742135 RepID=UPI0015904D2C|nr:DUF4328 domain-containing protein [Kitasatospora sp. NA04385]QKW20454.1 DUF4328 domain-containing protein [Kitasatospora sp. NA04385]
MASPAVYRSPSGLATASVLLLGLNGAASLASVPVMLRLYTAEPGDDITSLVDFFGTDAARNAGLLLSAATAVVFVLWLYRVRVNAEVIHPHGRQYARGWAVGGWVVPLVNLWFPWRITNDVWRASGPPGEHGAPRPAPAGLVHAWWATLVLGKLLALLGTRSMDSGAARHDVDSYRQAVSLLIASELLVAAAAVLAVLVVRRLTAMQEEHAARARAAWTPAA